LLREATEPLTMKQIALRVMAHRGLNTVDDALVLTMTRGGASLRSYRYRGAICSIRDGRDGKYDLREIAVRQPSAGGLAVPQSKAELQL
jgi:hypothetical protein